MFALTGVDLAAGRILCPNKLWWTTLAANDDDLAQQLVWETTTVDYQCSCIGSPPVPYQ